MVKVYYIIQMVISILDNLNKDINMDMDIINIIMVISIKDYFNMIIYMAMAHIYGIIIQIIEIGIIEIII